VLQVLPEQLLVLVLLLLCLRHPFHSQAELLEGRKGLDG